MATMPAATCNLTGITHPSGRTVSYHRDGAVRIFQVTTTHDGQSQVLASNIDNLPFGGSPLT